MSDVHYQPEHCNTINVYLFVDDGKAAIDFYVQAFGGVVGDLLEGPDGTVMHASIRIGDSSLMLSQASEQWGTKSPQSLGGSPATLHLYVPDADATFQQAIASGCTEIAPPTDYFWGERMAKVEDPFGFQWGIATQTELVSAEEMQRRSAEWLKQMGDAGPSS